jgi:MoaA/NifB/PqqE/SkfB family radical SAM enzyme
LKDLNVQFVISLDGANAELHEKLRVGCSFDKVIQSIKFFVENRKNERGERRTSSFYVYGINVVTGEKEVIHYRLKE